MEGFSGFRLYPLQKVIGDLFVIAVVTPYMEEILPQDGLILLYCHFKKLFN